MQIGGVLTSNQIADAFIHQINARVGDYTFEMPVAVSTSSTIPTILGRQGVLDRFMVSLNQGKELILEV